MKLEELPEIKKGTIAEIGYIQPDVLDKPNNPFNEPEFKLYYVEGIVYIESLPTFDVVPHFRTHGKPGKGLESVPALRVYDQKYRTKGKKGRLKFDVLSERYMCIEAIISFRPLEYKPMGGT